MALKIIMQHQLTRAEKEIREYFAAKHAQQLRRPDPESMGLYGIAEHTTRYPIICDECGQTYWGSSPWTTHAKCPKSSDFKVGF